MSHLFTWIHPKMKDRWSRTRNCLGSGQADLSKRLTAIHWSSSSFPRKTTLGALSPYSDTMLSREKLDVAAFNWSRLYSLNTGNAVASSLKAPFSDEKQMKPVSQQENSQDKVKVIRDQICRRSSVDVRELKWDSESGTEIGVVEGRRKTGGPPAERELGAANSHSYQRRILEIDFQRKMKACLA